MSKEVKKRKKKKVVKNKRKRKKRSVKNLKVSNINKFNYNLALLKMVSVIGIGAIFGISSHEEVPVAQSFEKVSYTKEIANLNVNFEPFVSMDNYNIVTKANVINLISDNEIECFEDEIIIDTPIDDETEIEIISETSFIDDETVIEVIDEPSLCGMKLSREFEEDIIEIANEYGLDPEIMFTVGHQESDGNWNNNGLISPTKDYGVFQINKFNHQHIYEVFGYTSEDLLYDPVKNAEAAAYLIRNIIKRSDVNSLEEIFGMYNGWTNWQNIEWSIEYVNSCLEIMNNYFPDYQYENDKELLKKM